MKVSAAAIVALVSVASAAPATPNGLDKRQVTANELTSGSCKKITLIFARASTEIGNMGESMGPAVCSGLKAKFKGEVACQGVGGAYSAGLMDNVSTSGTSKGAIAEATKMFTTAASKCPESIIVAGGYSQGTAVMENAIMGLPDNIRSKVVGVVLFGYTKNGQTKSNIPNYPKEKLMVLCRSDDGVCGGALAVTAGHFGYLMDGSGTKATNFLVEKINSAGKGGSSGSESSSSESKPKAAKGGGLSGLAKGKGGSI